MKILFGISIGMLVYLICAACLAYLFQREYHLLTTMMATFVEVCSLLVAFKIYDKYIN